MQSWVTLMPERIADGGFMARAAQPGTATEGGGLEEKGHLMGRILPLQCIVPLCGQLQHFKSAWTVHTLHVPTCCQMTLPYCSSVCKITQPALQNSQLCGLR